MKKRILSILLLCCMVLTLLPTAAFAAGEIDEQFTLAPGGTYYFDLSAMGIPGTVNDALPDKTMRYVPFTYAGTVDSYKLTSEMATTEEYAETYKYAHSLFIADFAVTHEVSWDELNAGRLIFGKDCAAGGVEYMLRAPSVGSDSAGSGDSQHGTPQSNEWDRILDKNDGYIKNWSRMHSWGQDISRSSWTTRAFRGYISARYWTASWSESSRPSVGFRPVLEILNPGTLGSDGLKAVTLDLGGGKLGNSFKDIQIIVKKGSEFTAPASDGLTRPDGNADSYFQWLGSDGKLYAPGDSVPADVIKLTAQFDFKEQFTLAPGGVYYFDLSGVSIPGTANGSLPDKTMHYVPFTYAGTVVAYKLTSEMATTEEYAQQNEYAHSLFVADYAVTHAVSWDNLNAEGLIFGKGYATGSVDYTLRAPSGGSGGTGSGALERGTPQSNEWDRILDKDDGYIKNWRNIGSWGQDTLPNTLSNRVIRGQDDLPRTYAGANTTLSFPFLGFRPVLEVLNPGTLGSDGLKAVTLDLGGGKLGGSSDTIQIIVKTGESFTAPASEGLTRPDGNTGSYFEWLGSDGELYAPDDNVPADVTKLTAQFTPSSHSVTITTDTLSDGKVGEAYSQILTATGTTPITWSFDGGNLPAGLSLNKDTGEISGTPTAAGTASFTVKAANITGSDTKELSITIEAADPVELDPVPYLDADGKRQVCTEYTVLKSNTANSILDLENKWYELPAGWYVVEGDVTITPRVDTQGEVNLILKDGCHFKAEWGINVKKGDTFTVYAQSTGEDTMGKLTACLPEDFNSDGSVDYVVWPDEGLSGIGGGVRWMKANNAIYESEGTIVINGGNIRARGQNRASAIGGTSQDHAGVDSSGFSSEKRLGGSITINGGIVRTEAITRGVAITAFSVGIGSCCSGYGGSVTINGGTVIANAASSAISTGRDGSITINGGTVTARGGINNFAVEKYALILGNGIGPYWTGTVTVNGGKIKASTAGQGSGIGGSRSPTKVIINGGDIEAVADQNGTGQNGTEPISTAGIGGVGSVSITGGSISATGNGGAAGIGGNAEISITGGEITVSATGTGAAIGGAAGKDCKSIHIQGDVLKSVSSVNGACIGAANGKGSGNITIANVKLSSLSGKYILIGWEADSPESQLTIQNCRITSTDADTSSSADGIRAGKNSSILIEASEVKLPQKSCVRAGDGGSITVRGSELYTHGVFGSAEYRETLTLKKVEITGSTVVTGDVIGGKGDSSSVDEIVIRNSNISLDSTDIYNRYSIGCGKNGSFGSIDIQNSTIDIPRGSDSAAIGSAMGGSFTGESLIHIADSQVTVACLRRSPAIGAGVSSYGNGKLKICIENSNVIAKGGSMRTDSDYIPGIGRHGSADKPEVYIQILNSTVESFRHTKTNVEDDSDLVYDDLHTKELPGVPAENIAICGSTVNETRIDHSCDQYGKCTICGKYDLAYCYEHGLLTIEGLTDCVSDGSEKKLTKLSHKTGKDVDTPLTEGTDYTVIYSNNVGPYTLTPEDEGFDPAKAPKVTLCGTGNYCGKAEHYFTISENAAAAPSITTSSLPDGKVGEAYSQTLTANGTTPIKWSISGALPDGLTLDETTGKISGTPTAAGSSTFTVKATNSAGSDTKELSITITKDAPPAHEHSYGDWRKDGTSHWHECTYDDCPNREESIKDKAVHDYDDDADTTCDVCGYERTVTPPSHEHSYGDWSKDGTSHWHECTDDDCPNREESINDKAAHVYDDDADTTCDVCGYERTVTPPSHEHSYGDWSRDGTNHWHECTDADCPNREESIKDKTAHVYDNDADTTCNTCGYERTVTPPAHEHIVTFDGNGGTPSVGSMTTTNQKLTSLPSASRSKHSFDGWYTKKNGGTKITKDTVFHADTTVYAHWTYIGGGDGGYNPPVTYYTLRFETGGGSDIPSVQGTYNTYIDLTQYVPTWRGHTFIGWYSERSLTNKVSGVYLTKDMTVYALWRVDENPGIGANPFTDVSQKDWFYGDVMFVYENGLILGTSKTLFSPHGTATRSMMATILWRMEGSPAPKGKNSFTDVEAGKWYADAITWTAENGIFAGYGKDKFGPDDPITREQLAAIFYRYADYKGYDLTVKGNPDTFKDADKITDYAKTAMQWAVGSGLVKGKSGNLLDPQGTATRAEIAAMLQRFIEKYELVQGKAPGGLMG